MQRTVPSSSSMSSVPFADSVCISMVCSLELLSFSSPLPRFRRVCIVSSGTFKMPSLSSSGSDDKDPEGVDFRGESVFWCDLVALSARPDELEDAEEWEGPPRGWLARLALEERLATSMVNYTRRYPEHRFYVSIT